jgi:AhpD family alkylhydroperoxidase
MDGSTFRRHVPGVYPALEALGETGAASGVEQELLELVRLRVSQINGCAYCVQYHAGNLRKHGVSEDKLTLVVAWEESGIFSVREQAALAWAETVTLIAQTRVPDAAYEAVSACFSEREIAGLTTAIVEINGWNRIAISFRYPPDSEG